MEQPVCATRGSYIPLQPSLANGVQERKCPNKVGLSQTIRADQGIDRTKFQLLNGSYTFEPLNRDAV